MRRRKGGEGQGPAAAPARQRRGGGSGDRHAAAAGLRRAAGDWAFCSAIMTQPQQLSMRPSCTLQPFGTWCTSCARRPGLLSSPTAMWPMTFTDVHVTPCSNRECEWQRRQARGHRPDHLRQRSRQHQQRQVLWVAVIGITMMSVWLSRRAGPLEKFYSCCIACHVSQPVHVCTIEPTMQLS